MVEPPSVRGAVKATETDPLPAVTAPITGAADVVAYISADGLLSDPLFDGVNVTGPGSTGVIVNVWAAEDPLNVNTTGVDNPPPEGVTVMVPV